MALNLSAFEKKEPTQRTGLNLSAFGETSAQSTPQTKSARPDSVTRQIATAIPGAISEGVSGYLAEENKIRKSQTTGQNFKRTFFEKPLGIYKFLAQGIGGSVIGLGRSIQESVASPVLGKEKAREVTQGGQEAFGINFDQVLGGQERIESYQEIHDNVKSFLDEAPAAQDWEKKFLPGTLAFGLFALDAWPGKPNPKKLVQDTIENIAKETTSKKIQKELVEQGIDKTIAKNLSPKLVDTKTPDAVRSVIREEAGDLFQEAATRKIRSVDIPVSLKPVSTEDATSALQRWISGANRRAMTPEVQTVLSNLNFRPAERVTLYRQGDINRTEFQSWSRVDPGGERQVEIFEPDEILIDTTDPRLREIFPEPEVLDRFNNVENEIIVRPNITFPESIVEPRTDDQIISGALSRYSGRAQEPPSPVIPALQEAAKIPRPAESGLQLASDLFTPISSRLGRINPKLKSNLRRFEFRSAQQTHQDSIPVTEFLSKVQKIPESERGVFDLAQKNGDGEVLEALARKHGFEEELLTVQKTLDDVYNRAKEVGIDVKYRKNYFPRMVKNPPAFSAYLRSRDDWGLLQRMIQSQAERKGKLYTDLTPEEVTGIVNNSLRGFGDKVTLAQPGSAKGRVIDTVDDQLNQFYLSSDEALSHYIIRMNDEIEGRRFFGKSLKNVDADEVNAEDSIGAYVMDLIQKGELNAKQQDEVTNVLKARFKRGQMNGLIDAYRNMEYLSTMGSPISAITQIGDMAWSIYDNGLYHTAKGLTKGKNRITKEDLGIEQITQEFTTKTKMGKAVDRVFKMVGLEQIDRLGKETLVNAEMSKFASQASKNSPELQRYLSEMFDEAEVPKVMDDFANRRVNDDTKLVLFNKLLDFQPVAKSEMPRAYLEHPNGRLLYMLKSFTLKQYDVFRREAVDHIISGEKARVKKGMKNLILLSSAFMMMNATADEIKDTILGRETPPVDRLVDNFYRLFGASKFDIYKARQEGVGSTVLRKFLPPISVPDRAYQDVTRWLEGKTYSKGPNAGERYELESTQTIPVGGKLYYWWFGRGNQKMQQRGERGDTTDLDIGLDLEGADIQGVDIGDVGI